VVSAVTDVQPRGQAALCWLPTEPFAHLDDIHRRTTRLMREFALPAAAPGERHTPAVDIEETHDECVIEVDLPGAGAKDVIVEIGDRSLTLRGHRPAREHRGVLRRQTRVTGPLQYTIELPCPVRGDRTTATISRGVLTVHAPKAHPGPARRVHLVDVDDSAEVQP
jgi:HSP20 family protein